ncbi:hypothetical protein BOTBODRAFT_203126 [Botryobasidium botryosum FD-172 SS1]|uniref:Uncharacterized protein n=1 Tax=Botryobasidium botryosum (strain FD-172 SS1) TaxID=930990 RepID=A0A067N3A2_BOTB1|nr:hypothetical protein BOTBODRAFT_203126 [Botryobasidium botryosum FD-172 SS1]
MAQHASPSLAIPSSSSAPRLRQFSRASSNASSPSSSPPTPSTGFATDDAHHASLPANSQPSGQQRKRKVLESLQIAQWRPLFWIYALLCVIFTTHRICNPVVKTWSASAGRGSLAESGGAKATAHSVSYLLSKTSPVIAAPLSNSLYPYMLRPSDYKDIQFSEGAEGITACFWVSESDIGRLEDWVKNWGGPVSVLLTTVHSPTGDPYRNLVTKLKAQHSDVSLLRQHVTLHLLHAPHPRSYTSNALLNLARLFAPTKKTLLFPPGLRHLSQPSLRHSLLDSALLAPSSLSDLYQIIPANATVSLPGNPLSPDSVLLIDRNASLWCPERFFAAPDPIAEWEECLWQVWLSGGSTSTIGPGDGWALFASPTALRAKRDPGSVYARIHHKMSERYRAEACMHVARQMASLGEWNKGDDKDIKVRRVMDMCAQTLIQWGRRLLD